jgi:hypothetical protein
MRAEFTRRDDQRIAYRDLQIFNFEFLMYF